MEVIIMTRDIIGRIEKGIGAYKDKTAIKVITSDGTETIDYGVLNKSKNNFAAHLKYNRGINNGDEIGVLGSPSTAYASGLLGIIKAGAVPALMDPESAKEEIEKLTEKHNFDAVAIPENQELTEKAPDVPIINLDRANRELPVSNSQIEEVNQNYYENVNLSDLGILMSTSGTTGLPKIAELAHRNFDFVIERTSNKMKVTSDDVLSSIAPWHHIMGLTTTLFLSLYNKSSLVYVAPNKRLMRSLPKFLEENKISIFLGVPKLFNKLYHRVKEEIEDKLSGRLLERFKTGKKLLGKKVRKKLGATSLRFLASGGAPLLPEVASFFEDLGISCAEGYGLTECTALASFVEPHLTKPDCVGKPMPDTDLKIVNPETLEEKKPGEKGEVIISGDHLMNGYHNNPEATKEVFVELNGKTYLRTGDWGILTEENYLQIKGRRKNIIVRDSGKNINPEQIEQILGHSPLIEEMLVKDIKRKGVTVLEAFVYPNFRELQDIEIINSNQIELSEKERKKIKETIWQTIDKNNKNLAPFKRIKSKGHLHIETQPFEKTSTQKIKRHKHEVDSE